MQLGVTRPDATNLENRSGLHHRYAAGPRRPWPYRWASRVRAGTVAPPPPPPHTRRPCEHGLQMQWFPDRSGLDILCLERLANLLGCSAKRYRVDLNDGSANDLDRTCFASGMNSIPGRLPRRFW